MTKKEWKKVLKLAKKRDQIMDEMREVQGYNRKCVDCGVDTHHIRESYMVIDQTWKKAGMKPNGGCLCVGCIEKRLGRKLRCRDFFMIGLNINAYIYPHAASKRLRKRLHRVKGK